MHLSPPEPMHIKTIPFFVAGTEWMHTRMVQTIYLHHVTDRMQYQQNNITAYAIRSLARRVKLSTPLFVAFGRPRKKIFSIQNQKSLFRLKRKWFGRIWWSFRSNNSMAAASLTLLSKISLTTASNFEFSWEQLKRITEEPFHKQYVSNTVNRLKHIAAFDNQCNSKWLSHRHLISPSPNIFVEKNIFSEIPFPFRSHSTNNSQVATATKKHILFVIIHHGLPTEVTLKTVSVRWCTIAELKLPTINANTRELTQ